MKRDGRVMSARLFQHRFGQIDSRYVITGDPKHRRMFSRAATKIQDCFTWLRSELDARTFDPDRGDPLPEVDKALGQFLGMPMSSRPALPAGV